MYSVDELKVIPKGCYCYDENGSCPHLQIDEPLRPGFPAGMPALKCVLLDVNEDLLLDDHCKICGINDENMILWRTEFQQKAYKDQFGRWHPGMVVVEVAKLIRFEFRDVPCAWTEKRGYRGQRGWTLEGREFQCATWHQYPTDSMTPEFYWYSRSPEGNAEQWCDAVQAANFRHHIPFVFPNGQPVQIEGAVLCEAHQEWYYEDDECFYCRHKIPRAGLTS